MCGVQTSAREAHSTNMRHAASEIVTDEWWFGFEQEYFLTNLMVQFWVGKKVYLKNHKVNTIVALVQQMLKEEKFPRLI